jgi:hypothetical protein
MKGKIEKRGGSGSGLFLMEMIVVVFFFVICASQCILAFATSEKMSRQGRELNQAVTMAESIVEVWKQEGTNGLTNRLGFSEESAPGSDGSQVYLAKMDGEWRPAGSAEGDNWRVARIEIREEDGMAEATVTMENPPDLPAVAYRGEAAELLPDSEDRVVFVLEARKYVHPQR